MWERLNNCNAYEMYETRPAPVVLPTTTARPGIKFLESSLLFRKNANFECGKKSFPEI